MSSANAAEIVKTGLWHNNPALVQLLGMCPMLAVSTSTLNGLGLGLATTLVLVASNLSVSLARNQVKAEIRVPVPSSDRAARSSTPRPGSLRSCRRRCPNGPSWVWAARP